MATTYKGATQRIYNDTGVQLGAAKLLSIIGFDLNSRTVTVALARANKSNRRANLVTKTAVGAGRVGYAYEHILLEDIDTSAFGNPDGRIFYLEQIGEDYKASWERREFIFPGGLGMYVLAFGQDNDGELYVLTSEYSGPSKRTGKVWKVVAG